MKHEVMESDPCQRPRLRRSRDRQIQIATRAKQPAARGQRIGLGDSPRDLTVALRLPTLWLETQQPKMLVRGVLETEMAKETMHWENDTLRSLLVSTVPHHFPAFLFPTAGRADAPGLPP